MGVESKFDEGGEGDIIFEEKDCSSGKKKNSLKPFILYYHHDGEGLSYLRYMEEE